MSAIRLCETCGEPLVVSRESKRFCSGRCRARAARLREKPDRLIALDGAGERLDRLDEAHLVAAIARAGATDWRACAWLLERRYPERWSSPALRRGSWQPVERERVDEDDPFREVDELARHRREQLERPRPR
jgi:hypothetical protein